MPSLIRVTHKPNSARNQLADTLFSWLDYPAVLRWTVLPLNGRKTLSFIRVIGTHKLRVSSE